MADVRVRGGGAADAPEVEAVVLLGIEVGEEGERSYGPGTQQQPVQIALKCRHSCQEDEKAPY